MLPIEEWLQDAQALPVGRSERVYHGAEHRRNMLIKNKPAGWSCWCFSCQDGGFVPKEQVELLRDTLDVFLEGGYIDE